MKSEPLSHTEAGNLNAHKTDPGKSPKWLAKLILEVTLARMTIATWTAGPKVRTSSGKTFTSAMAEYEGKKWQTSASFGNDRGDHIVTVIVKTMYL